MTTALSRGERWAFTPRRWWLYVIVAVALSLAGAVPLSALAHWLFPTSPTPDLGAGRVPASWLIVLVAVVSPLIETLMMSGPLLLFDRLAGHRVAVAGSALLWAVLHSMVVPAWGLVIGLS